MRKIVQFQSTTAYVWALTEDGTLWRKTHKGDEWTAIRGPGDQNPFARQPTLEERAAAAGGGFCKPARGRRRPDDD
jgi:hypothetical protein